MAYFKRDPRGSIEKILLKDSPEAEMSDSEIVEYRTKKSIKALIGKDEDIANALSFFLIVFWIFSFIFLSWLIIEITFILFLFLPVILWFLFSGYRKKKKALKLVDEHRKRWRQALEKGGKYSRVDREYGYQFTTTFNRNELSGNIKNQYQMDAINGTSKKFPVQLSSYDDKTWYYYKDEIWITNEVYVTKEAAISLKYTGDRKYEDNDSIKEFTTAYVPSDSLKEVLIDKMVDGASRIEYVRVSEDLKYLIDSQEIKKKKRIEAAKNFTESKGKTKSDERSRKIEQEVKDRVWNRDGGKCVECGSNEDLEFDHIIPFSKGGSNTYRNIQLLCEHCNRSKSNKIG